LVVTFDSPKKRRRESFWSLCCNKIFQISIDISDIFSFWSNLPVFTVLRSAGSRGCVMFWRLSNLGFLNFLLSGRNASSSQLFDRHGSSGAFNTGHLIGSNTKARSKMFFCKSKYAKQNS
jgi:hypothetical protein